MNEELKVGDWVRLIKLGCNSSPDADLYEATLVQLGRTYQIGVEEHGNFGLVGIYNHHWANPESNCHWWFKRSQFEKVNIFQERVRQINQKHENSN